MSFMKSYKQMKIYILKVYMDLWGP
uniref:Uncharacterized protein n=1 Tax=Anguilla anguilla TaxID=7936 RepID=A0A0E9XHE2_ANGAN